MLQGNGIFLKLLKSFFILEKRFDKVLHVIAEPLPCLFIRFYKIENMYKLFYIFLFSNHFF